MRTIFLLPPSEGKNKEHLYETEVLSFTFEKPLEILENVTEKDLKCKGTRFAEAQVLNNSLANSGTLEAIKRYSGVMYHAIDYEDMSEHGKNFFDKHFLIFSGLYGILTPQDKIANYKLPIEVKGLYDFWWEQVPEALKNLEADVIVNLLPLSYAKLIGLGTNCSKHKKKLEKILEHTATKIVNINFLKPDGKKISHGVKKVKGEWIKNICEKEIRSLEDFGGEIFENDRIVDINITIKK